MLEDAPELVERAILLHGDREGVERLRFHDEFLVGFDLRFDGRSRIKLYPDVRAAELQDPSLRTRLRATLSDTAVGLLELCSWTHVYLAHNQGTILQFHPESPDDFAENLLPEDPFRRIHAPYCGRRLLDMVVSVSELELARSRPHDFAVYYMPAEEPD